jgi:hypothetical protein
MGKKPEVIDEPQADLVESVAPAETEKEDTPPVVAVSNGPSLSEIAETHAESYEGFDANLHAVDADGKPRRKADGSYALKRGRKANTAADALPPKNAASVTGAGASVTPSQVVTISLDEAARQSANLVVNVAVWTLGSEIGMPTDKAEADGLKLTFRNYYESRGVPKFPPELGLLIGLASYIGPRLAHEKSQPKIQGMMLWAKSKIAAVRGK